MTEEAGYFPGEEGAFEKASPSPGPPLPVKLLLWCGWQVPLFGLRGAISFRDRERGERHRFPYLAWKRRYCLRPCRHSDLRNVLARSRGGRSRYRSPRNGDTSGQQRRYAIGWSRIGMTVPAGEGIRPWMGPGRVWEDRKIMFLPGYKYFPSRDGLSLDGRPVLL